MHRRSVLATGAAGVGLSTLSPAAHAAERPRGSGRTFQHGVASGDPLPRSVVLWTRVTPTAAAAPGSGRGPSVVVEWEVATDRRFRRIVRRGRVRTGPHRDHTVKVDADGLRPDTWYHYRFRLGRRVSPVGRTRTAPPAASTPDRVRLGVVSCANLQAGWFSAYRALAGREDLDAVVHLGDYLYEYGPGEYGYGHDDVDIRPHQPPHETLVLADYRQRHAQYKQDPDLQALHARYPWIVTWDDHEVTNDQWSGGAENHQPGEGDYAARRAQAHRAYDEWMPVRMEGTARLGDGDRLFRRIRFGRLAELSMLDLRTYRSQQVAGALPLPGLDPAVSDPARTITGEEQMAWLKESLADDRAQWKVIGNPVMIAPVDFGAVPRQLIDPVNDVTGLLPADGVAYNVDQWDGYTADRREVLTHIRDRGVSGALFITGDIHSAWAAELPYDAATYPLGDSAGVEFVCSSVTSNNLKDVLGAPPRTASLAVEAAIVANNRHVRFLDFDNHGFCVLDLTPQRAQMDWYVIGDRADRATPVTWSRSLQTRAGSSRITEANGPVQ
nr:alkaline phosphatase D family protein [Nocardioides flavescens]